MTKPKSYTVIQTPQAVEQLTKIATYISANLKNPDAARSFLSKVDELDEYLKSFPSKCPFTPEHPWNDTIHRTVIEGYRYYAYFWIDEDNSKVYIIGYAFEGRDQQAFLSSLENN